MREWSRRLALFVYMWKLKKKVFEREKLFVIVSVFVYYVEGHTLKMCQYRVPKTFQGWQHIYIYIYVYM